MDLCFTCNLGRFKFQGLQVTHKTAKFMFLKNFYIFELEYCNKVTTVDVYLDMLYSE